MEWIRNLVNFETINIAFSSKGIQVCEARVVREKKGMPWNNRIAVHPLKDGTVELTPVRAPKSNLKLK